MRSEKMRTDEAGNLQGNSFKRVLRVEIKRWLGGEKGKVKEWGCSLENHSRERKQRALGWWYSLVVEFLLLSISITAIKKGKEREKGKEGRKGNQQSFPGQHG